MRKQLGIVGLFVAGLAVAAPLQAQGPRGGRMGPDLDEQMVQLTERLSLDEEQVVDVRRILEMQGEKRREAFQSAAGDRSAMMAAMQELEEETSLMLAEVLTEEQMAEYEEIAAERRQRRGPPPF